MVDTATPSEGPVDAPDAIDGILAEIGEGNEGEAPADELDALTQELVNEAESEGDSEQEPETEDDATDPADESEEAEKTLPEEKSYTVKVNGEEITVPESELLNGYSRTADYKQKTAALAEERRAVEAERSKLEPTLKAEYANQLEEATNLFAQYDPVLIEANKIDWAQLKANDPAAYVQAQDAVQARWNAIQQMQQRAQQARTEAQQAQSAQAEQSRAERFDAAADKIVEAMPELADEAKFTEFAQSAVGYLRNEGFDQAEIAEVLDHRVLTLADKARRWDAHLAAQKSLPEKKVVPKSAVKPLRTDSSGSRASNTRFPGERATRDSKLDWAVQQLLSEE